MPLITHQEFQRILNQPIVTDHASTLTLEMLNDAQARYVRTRYKSTSQPSIGKHRIIPFPDIKE